MDDTANIRKSLVQKINSEVETNDKDAERKRLESNYGQVWNTEELSTTFEVLGFLAPFVVVRKKDTGEKGSLEFQHDPRFYFNYTKN